MTSQTIGGAGVRGTGLDSTAVRDRLLDALGAVTWPDGSTVGLPGPGEPVTARIADLLTPTVRDLALHLHLEQSATQAISDWLDALPQHTHELLDPVRRRCEQMAAALPGPMSNQVYVAHVSTLLKIVDALVARSGAAGSAREGNAR